MIAKRTRGNSVLSHCSLSSHLLPIPQRSPFLLSHLTAILPSSSMDYYATHVIRKSKCGLRSSCFPAAQRNWTLLHLHPETRPSRRFLNLATAASCPSAATFTSARRRGLCTWWVELGTSLPRLVEVVNKRRLVAEHPDALGYTRIFSFLVSGGPARTTKMLMVRFWTVVEDVVKEVFMVNGVASCIEVLEVHGRRRPGGGCSPSQASAGTQFLGVNQSPNPIRAPLHGHVPLDRSRRMPGLRYPASSAVQHVPNQQEQEGMQEGRTPAVRAML